MILCLKMMTVKEIKSIHCKSTDSSKKGVSCASEMWDELRMKSPSL